MHMVVAARACGCQRVASLRPGSSVTCGLQLDDLPIAIKALFEYEVLGQACVHAVHGYPFRQWMEVDRAAAGEVIRVGTQDVMLSPFCQAGTPEQEVSNKATGFYVVVAL